MSSEVWYLFLGLIVGFILVNLGPWIHKILRRSRP